MPKKYTRDQYWQLFEKLPEELKDLILAEETAKDIYDICERNDVDVFLVPKVAKYAGNVLMGILPPEEFEGVLEKEVGLKKAKAKEVAREIHRHIFFPVRGLLEQLYRVEITPVPAKAPAETEARKAREEAAPAKKKPLKEKPKKPDIYRESIE